MQPREGWKERGRYKKTRLRAQCCTETLPESVTNQMRQKQELGLAGVFKSERGKKVQRIELLFMCLFEVYSSLLYSNATDHGVIEFRRCSLYFSDLACILPGKASVSGFFGLRRCKNVNDYETLMKPDWCGKPTLDICG